MKKGIKIAAFFLGALAVLFIGLSIFIKAYLTSERVKGLVLPYAEKALGRKIAVEDVKIHILTGIEISKVSIQDNPAFSSGPFLTADEFVLKYAFWPLFKKKLIIHQVLAVRPHISIARNERGAFNFSDLSAKAGAGSTKPKEPEPPSQGFVPLISEVEIEDGEIVFTDQSVHPASSLLVQKVNFTAEDISPTSPMTVTLSAELPGRGGARLDITGQVDPVSHTSDLQVKVDSLDLKILSPYYHQAVPLTVLSSRLNLSSRIMSAAGMDTTGGRIQADGQISLDELKFIYPDTTSKEPVQGLNLKGDYVLKADMSQHLVQVERMNLSVVQIPVQVTGRIASFNTPARQVDLRLSASEIDLARLKTTVPPSLLPKALEKITLGGKILGLQASIRKAGEAGGQAQAPLAWFGQARLSAVQVAYQPYASLVPRIDGNLQFDRQKVHIPKLTAALVGSQTILSGTISDYLEKPVMNLKIESQIPDMARIYQALPPALSPWLTRVKLQQGAARITANLSGNPAEFSSLRYQGDALLRQIKIQPLAADPSLVSRINGLLKFTENELGVENLNASLPRSDLTLNGKISNYRTTPVMQMDVTSPRISLDEILASTQALTAQPEGEKEKAPPKEPAPAGAPEEKLSASGKVHLARATYKSLTMQNVDLAYSLQNGILRWQNLKAEVPGQGIITADGMLDTDKTIYSSKLSIQSLPVQEVLMALAPKYASIFSGNASSSINLAGEGKDKAKIRQSLNLTGNFQLADGKIRNTELGKSLSSLLPVADWSELAFKTLKGKVAVEEGKIHLDSSLAREDYVLEPKGTIGLDSSLSMDIMVRISPRITRGNKILSQYVTDDKGWIMIPVKAGGTLTRPALKVDLAAVGKGLQEKAKKQLEEKFWKEEEKAREELEEKLKEKLRQRFFDKSSPKDGRESNQEQSPKEVSNEGTAAKPKPVEDVLKDTLKGFFRKGE
ncbi:MAG: DUF748 domain-containing protein [bacterium]